MRRLNHKTVFDKDFEIIDDDFLFQYQSKLTKKLDSDSSGFDQNRLNEIVLWKVNRYAEFDEKLIFELNSIKTNSEQIELEKTKRVLKMLLETKGVQLAMASTILRFRNPQIYQIIDQRVYRIIYKGKTLALNNYLSDENINQQIDLYLKYLADLKQVCINLKIDYTKADRILYMADKRVNKNHKLGNY